MSAHAARAVPGGARVLTHCNAGGLATGGYGTALGAVRAAWEAGRVAHVWVDETRPLLQGARLTAWELEQLGIPHAVIVDGAAASFMARGEVDVVVTGADRIAANGDTANKIGTYGLAVLARHHGIPLVVVAPTSTLDPATPSGDAIPIEERDASRGDGPVPRPQPRLRRHAGGADRRRSSPRRACIARRTPRPCRARDDSRRRRPRHPRRARALRLRRGALQRARRHASPVASSRPRRTRSAGVVEPPERRTTSIALPEPGGPGLRRGARRGLEALRAGRVAAVVLAGGMATRFGGVVKGVRRGARRPQLPRMEAR